MKTDVSLKASLSYAESIKVIKFLIALEEKAGKLTLLELLVEGRPHFLWCKAVASSQETSLSQCANSCDTVVVAQLYVILPIAIASCVTFFSAHVNCFTDMSQLPLVG